MGKGCLSQHQLGLGVLPSLSMTLAELGLTNNPRILSLNWGHLRWLRTLAIYFVWNFCLNRSALAIPTNLCQICETSTSKIVMHKLFSQGQMTDAHHVGMAPFLPVSAASEEGQAPTCSLLTKNPGKTLHAQSR